MTDHLNQSRDRPISAYIPQGQQQSYVTNQGQHHHQGLYPRSQSSRDIIRQEAKLQEMQEEVRRRELRGGPPISNVYRPNAYNNVRPLIVGQPAANSVRQSRPPLGSTPNLGPPLPTTTYGGPRQLPPGYGYSETQYNHQNQFVPNQYGMMMMMMPKGKNDTSQDSPSTRPDSTRQFIVEQRQQQYSNSQNGVGGGSYSSEQTTELRNDQYPTEGHLNWNQNGESGTTTTTTAGILGMENPPSRPLLPEDSFRESPPPPPPPNTSTHPLYNKQPDTRYTASMQDPPKGGYYPTTGTTQQPRQYQFSASNPWQREEREKVIFKVKKYLKYYPA